jgi:hypothetical protein
MGERCQHNEDAVDRRRWSDRGQHGYCFDCNREVWRRNTNWRWEAA